MEQKPQCNEMPLTYLSDNKLNESREFIPTTSLGHASLALLYIMMEGISITALNYAKLLMNCLVHRGTEKILSLLETTLCFRNVGSRTCSSFIDDGK